ncbi:single-stranded-DNA-specific exonuclease RecJ [Candidatus Sulfidibacterium hydrothermale]|uniref:single-stranded-DNA-specific exonuclease RecJ n=1 Tax=Candidatus Sulfidibacterium hydrothermale TaxID=2875962 RepID=UPI001F0A37E9|nr:single-stranded-DNA-specific exonuclease RecJ [Candidatus Sulfidibacterium hydrothermale]UBM62522.1 single-stranded-DNA-specific exonuclease RecJ [Candidatus Sulfidibacterium hydrothermale]
MEKRWVVKEEADRQMVMRLAEALDISPKLTNLLVQRGVTTFDEAKSFFRPSLDALHDPFLMKDMDKAVDRILQAISRNENIMVYGDYDVDGTTAVSLVYSFLKNIHKRIEFYIPDRYLEGYGISIKGIDTAAEHDVKLIIALDCGIKAIDKVKYASEKGIDFIIGDHHRPGETIPEAVAVLDPKRPDCPYPYKELSGAGVGFKLTQALASKLRISDKKVFAGLDLLAISIAADIVPITGENRILAYYGLQQINTQPRPGVYSILKSSGFEKVTEKTPKVKTVFNREITISDLVFVVGPRINAAGRIKDATDSVRLLISNHEEYAEKLGGEINVLNSTRRDLDSSITQEAIDMINASEKLKKKKTTVLFKEEWHKGVIGIVASRLIEHFYKPTIVLTLADGLITGSARSVKGFDIYDAIDSCSHLLAHFGGHTYAAGLAMKPENLDAFLEEFEAYAEKNLTDEMLIPEIEIDEELFLSDINSKFYRILKQFAPFGPGNMSPLFVSHHLIDTGYAKTVGRNGEARHLKFEVVHRDHSGNPLKAIAFNMGEHCEKMKQGKSFSLCYHLDENTWLGQTSLQLRVKDIRFQEETEE